MCAAGKRLSFLDLLLECEHRGELDEKSIQEEVDTFMFEGHDTTSTAVTWAMHLFGCHTDIQQKVYEEIIQVCGDSTEITLEHLAQMKYLECCLKETLRLYPSVPMISRQLGAPVQIGEHKIPAGIDVLINIYLIHHDATYWPDPEVFHPER
jgi:cytochrome P450